MSRSKQSIPLSVVIPCKDEVENIAACVASARLIATEVLVADSGSTDGTLAWAEKVADRVIKREYVNSGDFKNWAIPQARNEWVFILDADERITQDLATEIKRTIAEYDSEMTGTPGQPLAYSVPRRNFFLGHPLDYGDWSRDRVIRLLHRDQCKYKLHTDHAEIDVPRSQQGNLKEKLVHYTAWDLSTYLAKMHHYARQQAILWQQQQKTPALRHLILNAPMRFLRGYVLRLGFLDGMLGFFIACMTAYYSFLKQFLFWQFANGRTLSEVERNLLPELVSKSSYAADLSVADPADVAVEGKDGSASKAA